MRMPHVLNIYAKILYLNLEARQSDTLNKVSILDHNLICQSASPFIWSASFKKC